MLSILIGLACLAIIAAFWEQLAALLLLGVALVAGLIALSFAFYLWSEYSATIIALALFGGVFWLIGATIKHWRQLLRAGREFLLLLPRFGSFIARTVRLVLKPKVWTPDGMIAFGLVPGLPLLLLSAYHYEEYAIIGTGLFAVSLSGIGAARGLIEARDLRQIATPQGVVRALLSIGSVLLLIPGLFVWSSIGPEQGNASIAGSVMVAGAILWFVGVAMAASNDYRKPRVEPSASGLLP